MTRTAQRFALLAALVGLLPMILVGCQDDQPTTLPRVTEDATTSTSAPSSPTVTEPTASVTAPAGSATPAGADLDRAQQSAYDKALQDHATFKSVLSELNANPQPDQATADRLKQVSFNPASERFFTSIQRYARAKVRITGSEETFWQVPVRVDLAGEPRPVVTWRQCTGRGSLQVLDGATPIPQKDSRELSEFTSYAAEDGFWRVADVESKGSC